MSNNAALAAQAASSGCFFLPAFDDEVPQQLSKDWHRAKTLARFAMAAESAGVALPSGDYLEIDQVVAAQWNQFLTSNFPSGRFELAAGEPEILISDESLEVVIKAEPNLNAYQLKPVVEELERSAPGLGWFVHSVLSKASSHGHQLYDMTMITYMLDVFHSEIDEFTDQGYARSLMLENGYDSVPAIGKIPQETIDELKEQYSFWPSDLLAEAGGHEHLLAYWRSKSKKPFVMSSKRAKAWLKANRDHALAGAVDCAVRLERALQRDPTRDFVWNGQFDESEPIGAHGFIAWESPNLLFEAVEHMERNAYEGGQAVEAFARRSLAMDEATDDALKDLAASAVDYFSRWALLAEFLSYFPIWESDDET